MAVPTTANPMGGSLSIDINSVTIPAFMLGSISANVAQVLRTSERLSGTTTTPSNQLDNPSYDVVFYPNTWSDLQYFMPDNYEGTPGTDTGAFVVGDSTICAIPELSDVVFHYDCDDGTKRDVTFSANVSFEDNGERNATDDLSVTIHLYPVGGIQYGTPSTS